MYMFYEALRNLELIVQMVYDWLDARLWRCVAVILSFIPLVLYGLFH